MGATATAIHTDSYYRDTARAAINAAIAEAKERGKTSPEELRKAIRSRNCRPFTEAKGHPYKIFLQVMAEVETSLGLDPKKHKATLAREATMLTPTVTKSVEITSREQLLALEPKDRESAGYLLRTHFKSATFHLSGCDRLRITLKGTDAEESGVRWQRTTDIETDSVEEYDRIYIESAYKSWLMLCDLYEGKF